MGKVMFEPFGTTMLVKELVAERQSRLVMPEGYEGKSVDIVQFEVMAVGRGWYSGDKRIACEYQVGDVVYVTRGDCKDFELYGVKYGICDQRACIGKKLISPVSE